MSSDVLLIMEDGEFPDFRGEVFRGFLGAKGFEGKEFWGSSDLELWLY